MPARKRLRRSLPRTHALPLRASSGRRALSGGRRCGGQGEGAALSVAADGPELARVDDRATELLDPLECRGQVANGEVGREAVSPGPGPRSWTPRRRLSVSVSHPDPAAAGLGVSSTPRTPRQKRRARAGSSAGNSISGAGTDRSMAPSVLCCSSARGGSSLPDDYGVPLTHVGERQRARQGRTLGGCCQGGAVGTRAAGAQYQMTSRCPRGEPSGSARSSCRA